MFYSFRYPNNLIKSWQQIEFNKSNSDKSQIMTSKVSIKHFKAIFKFINLSHYTWP